MKIFKNITGFPKRLLMLVLLLGVAALLALLPNLQESLFKAQILPPVFPPPESSLIAQDTATVRLSKLADLSLQKGVSRTGSYQLNDTVEYVLTYQNLGPGTAKNVTLIDSYDSTKLTILDFGALPSGVTCNIATAAPSGSSIHCVIPDIPFPGTNVGAEIRYTAKVIAAGPASAQNTATVLSDNDPDTSNNTAVATISIGSLPVPTCSLNANPAQIDPNGSSVLTWQFSGQVDSAVINQGIGEVIDLDLPEVSVSPTQSTVYTMTVSGPNGSNTCSTTVTVNAETSTVFTLQKTAQPSTVAIGGAVEYTLSFRNTGAIDATGVRIVDDYDETRLSNLTLTSGCTASNGVITCQIGDVAAGMSANIPPYTAVVAGVTQPGDTIQNCATLTSDQSDPVTVCATVTVGTADFEVTKEASPAILQDGGTTEYTLRVRNQGTAIGSIRLEDAFEPLGQNGEIGSNGGSLDLADGDGGLTVTVQNGTAEVIGDISSGFTIRNATPGLEVIIRYTRQADATDIPAGESSDFKNNAVLGDGQKSDSATVTIRGAEPGPDLAIEIHVDDISAAPGQKLAYDLRWFNLGNVEMKNVTVTVDCDEDVGGKDPFTILTASGATTTDDATNVITWNLGDLAADPNDGPLFFEVQLTDGFGVPSAPFTCAAHIESAVTPISQEVNQDNNDDTVSIDVNSLNKDSKAKRVTNLSTGITSTAVQAAEGDELEYILSYTAGDTAVNGHVFEDDITDVLEYTVDGPNGEDCFISHSGGGSVAVNTDGKCIISWPAQNIPAFQTAEVKFRVRILDDLEGFGGDFKLQNVYGNDVTVVTLPDLIREKRVRVNGGEEFDQTTARPGDILEYILRVVNEGVVTRDAYIFEDDITDILEYTTNGENCEVLDAGGGTTAVNAENECIISWLPIDIPAEGSVEKRFRVQIDDPLVAGGDFTLRNVFGNSVTVVTLPTVVISKTVRNETTGQSGQSVNADAGHVLTYTLSATENSGTSNFQNFIFDDHLVSGEEGHHVGDVLDYVDSVGIVISDGGQLQNGVISWPPVTIPKNETVTRTFTVTILPPQNWPTGASFDRQMDNVFGNVVSVFLPGTIFEVDTHVEKVAKKDGEILSDQGTQGFIAVGQEFQYEITYWNEGNLPAGNVVITDDFDETKLEIVSKPNNCEVLPKDTEPQDLILRCLHQGVLDVVSDTNPARTLQYTVRVKTGASGDIINTAEIDQDGVDGDPSDNQSSVSVHVDEGVLFLEKSARPSSVTDGGEVTYTLKITNTSVNQNDTPKSFTITDTLLHFDNRGKPIPVTGNNRGGGTLTFVMNSVVVSGDANNSTSGVDIDREVFVVNDLPSGKQAVITYKAKASTEGINFNESSAVMNTAVIVDGQTPPDSVTVFINGPIKRTGGGGGGGGGTRTVSGDINLLITKEVKDENDKWQPADGFDTAALIPDKGEQAIRYRVQVTNEGSLSGENIEIEDKFVSNELERVAIRNISGAEFDPKRSVFTIKNIRSNETITILYDAVVRRLASAGEIIAGVNTVTLINADRPEDLPLRFRTSITGIGGDDSAFVTSGAYRGDVVLLKRADKTTVKPGEEVEYLITVHNRSTRDLNNVVVTDLFPFDYLEYLSSNVRAIRQEKQVEYRTNILRAGKLWAIRVKARVKSGVRAGTKIRNFATIRSDNADLSEQKDETEITVTGTPLPRRLQQTGPEWIVVLAMLGVFFLYSGVRRKRKEG